jgi:hypothetical protein
MGQQQLLMIVLALIIVGIAIAVSIVLFRANAIQHKRDILIEETSSLAAMAIQYYKKPPEMGGGGNSFLGWQIPPQMVVTANGNHMTSDIAPDHVIIVGIGNEVVTGNDSIEVKTTATPNSIVTTIIN